MFNVKEVVIKAIQKMAKEEELTALEQIIFNEFKKKQKLIERQRKKFDQTMELITHFDTGQTRIDPKTKKRVKITVPVFKYVGYDYGKKYTGEKLRELRRDRLKGVDLGSIPKDKVVDLWEPSGTVNELSRQQLRKLKREGQKHERRQLAISKRRKQQS